MSVGNHQVMISVIGCEWEFILYLMVWVRIPMTSFEQLYEVCMTWHLLREKPRQEML